MSSNENQPSSTPEDVATESTQQVSQTTPAADEKHNDVQDTSKDVETGGVTVSEGPSTNGNHVKDGDVPSQETSTEDAQSAQVHNEGNSKKDGHVTEKADLPANGVEVGHEGRTDSPTTNGAAQGNKENNKPAGQKKKNQAARKAKQQQQSGQAGTHDQNTQADEAAKEDTASEAKAYAENAGSWDEQMVADGAGQTQAKRSAKKNNRGSKNKKKQTEGQGTDEQSRNGQDGAVVENTAGEASASAKNAGSGEGNTSESQQLQQGQEHETPAQGNNPKTNQRQRQQKKNGKNAAASGMNGHVDQQANGHSSEEHPAEQTDNSHSQSLGLKSSRKESDLGGLNITDLRTVILANGSVLFRPQAVGRGFNHQLELVLAVKSGGSENDEPHHYAALVDKSGPAKVKTLIAGELSTNVRQAMKSLLGETEKRVGEMLHNST